PSHLHSFPTRRSSDLHTSNLDTPEGIVDARRSNITSGNAAVAVLNIHAGVGTGSFRAAKTVSHIQQGVRGHRDVVVHRVGSVFAKMKQAPHFIRIDGPDAHVFGGLVNLDLNLVGEGLRLIVRTGLNANRGGDFH